MPIAHAADWLTSLLYMLPVVGFMGWLMITHIRDRRSRRDEGEPRQPEDHKEKAERD